MPACECATALRRRLRWVPDWVELPGGGCSDCGGLFLPFEPLHFGEPAVVGTRESAPGGNCS